VKLIRDLKWKLADRFPALDRPGLYRRPVVDNPRASGIDAFLIGFGGLVLVLLGLLIIGAGLFVAAALIFA